jgi:hypothetical protein
LTPPALRYHPGVARRRLLGVITALAGAALAGCDATTLDGGAGAADAARPRCPEFVPCGGDVIGTWAPDPTCAPTTKTVGGGSCAGEAWDVTTVVSSVTWTFRADHTMTVRLAASGFATVTAPDACLPSSNGAPVACADAGPAYAARIVFMGSTASSGGCARSGADCRCRIDFTPVPVDAPGSYSTAGTMLSAVVGNRAPTVFDYCVADSKLTMRNPAPNGATGEPGSFVKQ